MFDNKFKIFHDNYIKISLPDYSWGKIFSIMLKERTVEYYYDHIAEHNYVFNIIIHMMREHFYIKKNY